MGRPGTTVFVGNISYETTEEQLKEVFSQAGTVCSFRLMYDHETGKAKGFGFCEYEDKETAMSARRNLNGTELNGRNLRVDLTENDKQAAAAAAAAQAAQAERLNAINIPGLPAALNSGNPTMARMSALEIHETMIALKKGIENDANLVRETLRAKPLLALAILHGQIMLGMVPPPSNPMNNMNTNNSIPMQQQQMAINPGVQPNMNPMMRQNAPNMMNMQQRNVPPPMMAMQQPPPMPLNNMNRPQPPVGVRSIQQQRQVQQQQMGRQQNPQMGGPPPGLRQPAQQMPGAPPGLRQPPQAMNPSGIRQPPPQMNAPGLRQPPSPGLRQPPQQMPGPPPPGLPPNISGAPPGLRQPPGAPGVPVGGGGLRQPPPQGLRQPPPGPVPPQGVPPSQNPAEPPLQLNEEQASLFATVMALTDEQIARLPAGEREGVMIVRNQFAQQQQQQQQAPPQQPPQYR